ncbi:MAG: winged helix-turn-helix domain-containing protein, partial [Desulfobacterales bacterium]|nr:winged helix-turn-helix domain-containing protein [Desulfobacterales bacterium]
MKSRDDRMAMSYERKMLEELAMPTREQIERALLRALLKYRGVIKEFGAGQEIVDEIADDFGLSEHQRSAYLQTIYRKENRIKKSLLWHRLLFRAADSLARDNLVSRPTQTFKLTNKREWMLTEKGFDQALKFCNIPISRKDSLPIKSYEGQKIAKRLADSRRPVNYNPIDSEKKVTKATREAILRVRGFRQAVIEAYSYRCAI